MAASFLKWIPKKYQGAPHAACAAEGSMGKTEKA